MKYLLTILIILLSLTFSNVIAQTTVESLNNTATMQYNPLGNVRPSFSLLNPERFKMSHLLSASYSSGTLMPDGSTLSHSNGLYLNTTSYQLANPLSIRLHLGYQYTPFQNDILMDNQSDNMLAGASLLYTPNHTTEIGFEYGITNYNYSLYNSPYYLMSNSNSKNSWQPMRGWFNSSFLDGKLTIRLEASNYNTIYQNKYNDKFFNSRGNDLWQK